MGQTIKRFDSQLEKINLQVELITLVLTQQGFKLPIVTQENHHSPHTIRTQVGTNQSPIETIVVCCSKK